MLTLPVHDAKNGGGVSSAVSLVKNEPHRHYQNGHLSHSESEDDDDDYNDMDVDEDDEDKKFKLDDDDDDDDDTLNLSSDQDKNKTKKTKKKNSRGRRRGRRLISSDEMATTVLLPPLEMSLDEQRVLGYMPLRDDFEREYKNDAETLLSNLSISNQQIVFLNR
jgi:hypothetical protein